jgi:antitoxin component of MazEF toxin-antitoxin module
MKTQITAFGDNLGISLPSNILKDFNLEYGSKVDVRVLKNKIEITAINKTENEISLDDMLQNVTSTNLHNEIFTC